MTVLHTDLNLTVQLQLTIQSICYGTTLSVVSPVLTQALEVNGTGATKASRTY